MSSDAADRGMTALGGALDAGELFPEEWMGEHTEFADVDSFVDAVGGGPSARESERRPGWNDHVAASTAFDDWTEMLERALDDYRSRRTAPLVE